MRSRIAKTLIPTIALLFGTAALTGHASTARFDEAAQLYQAGHWQLAADAFAVCIATNSEHEKHNAARFFLGESLVQLGDYSKAREHFQIVLSQETSGPYQCQALFRVGEASWLAGDAASAEQLFRQFVGKYPHNALAARAFIHLGEIASIDGAHDRSLAAYRTVIESYSHTPQIKAARLGMAKVLFNNQRESEVPLALGRLTEDENTSIAAEALLLLGRSFYETHQYDEALKTFRRIPSGEFSPQAILAAGWALWKLGDFDLVAAEIEPLADDPYWAVEHGYLLGMAAYGENKWPEAIKQLSQALQGSAKYPNRDAILFYLGENQLRDGQTDAAIESFRTLADQHARSIWADDALWGIARVARAVHQADQFEAAVAQLREQFPDSRYLELLGQLQTGEADYLALPYENQTLDEAAGLERDGRLDAALAAYQEVIGQDRVGRVHAEALRRAAHLHDRMAHYPEASVLYEQFLTKYPKSIYAAEVLSSQAWMAERRGDLACATAKFRTLHENFPQSAQAPEATYWLALAATDKKDSTKARYYIQWLLSALSKKTESRSQELWEQTLLLQCQLMAAEDEWQAILDLLANTENGFEEGTRKARAAFWLAESQYRTGNYDAARTAFDELNNQTSATAEPWVAMVPLRRAQLRSRRQQWTEVLKILGPEEQKPTDFQLQYEVNYLRGRAYAGRGEMSLARSAYRRVLEDELAAGTETSAMAQWMIGETFFHQNDYLRARQAYQRVIDLHSLPEWQARAALQAGKCMELEQSWDEAAAYYTAAIERWQESESAAQLEARLKWATSQTTQR